MDKVIPQKIQSHQKIQNKMYASVCIMVVGILAACAADEYKLVSVLMFLEFTLHEIAKQFGLIETQLLNPILIYLVYMIIQTAVLYVMYLYQVHFIIAFLVFSNLAYNFLTVLQHLGIFLYANNVYLDFHGGWVAVARIIMFLEILYLLGMNRYVGNYIRKYGVLDTNYIDRLFFIWRRIPIRSMA